MMLACIKPASEAYELQMAGVALIHVWFGVLVIVD